MLIERDAIILSKDISDTFNSLEIMHEGVAVQSNTMILKLGIVNYGDIDIDKTSIHKVLKVDLPKHFKVLDAKVIKSTSDVRHNLKTFKNAVSVGWDLLKSDEFILFNILVDFDSEKEKKQPEEKRMERWYNLSYRFTNLSKVEVESLISQTNKIEIPKTKFFRILSLIPVVSTLSIVAITLFAYPWNQNWRHYFNFGKPFDMEFIMDELFRFGLYISSLVFVMIHFFRWFMRNETVTKKDLAKDSVKIFK